MHDLIIREGNVVDGSGAPARVTDIAVNDGIVTELGRKLGRARRKINAQGSLVTPGFVDVHTHYDGQATWDPYLTPSSWHGVTTAIFFTPCSAISITVLSVYGSSHLVGPKRD